MNLDFLETSLTRNQMRTIDGGGGPGTGTQPITAGGECAPCTKSSDCASGACAQNYPRCSGGGGKCM